MCFPFFHKYKVVSVEQYVSGNVRTGAKRDVSLILSICSKCGNDIIKEVSGLWTLEQYQKRE